MVNTPEHINLVTGSLIMHGGADLACQANWSAWGVTALHGPDDAATC